MPDVFPTNMRAGHLEQIVRRASIALLEGISHERTSQGFQELISRKPLPMQLVQRYQKTAMKQAQVKQFDDGSWYASIPALPGVWANQPTVKESIEVLEDVLLHWLLLKIEDEDRDLPVLDGIDLNVL